MYTAQDYVAIKNELNEAEIKMEAARIAYIKAKDNFEAANTRLKKVYNSMFGDWYDQARDVERKILDNHNKKYDAKWQRSEKKRDTKIKKLWDDFYARIDAVVASAAAE